MRTEVELPICLYFSVRFVVNVLALFPSMSCLPCMSPKKSGGGAAHATTASTIAFGDEKGRDGVGGDRPDLAPASNLNDSLVRRAMTEIPASAASQQDVLVDDTGGQDAPSPPVVTPVRRTMTELPPIVSDDPVLEHRLSKSIRPVSVRFTTELADKHGLTRWKSAAIAVTGAHKLLLPSGTKAGANQLRRTDSRIAGTIERQQELERAHLDDSMKGYDEGVHLLEKRLNVMDLKTEQMGDDGNCQFRALSFNLFGSQEHHQLVRDTCVAHIMSKEDDYGIFFDPGSGEFEMYCRVSKNSRRFDTCPCPRVVLSFMHPRIHSVDLADETSFNTSTTSVFLSLPLQKPRHSSDSCAFLCSM